jgi:hypothetical protein
VLRRAALAVLLALAAIGAGPCRIATFLADADVDDDGFVGAADLNAVSACSGTDVGLPEIEYDAGGCPVRVGPPLTGCEAADVNRDGRVGPGDYTIVNDRVGQLVCNGSAELCGRRFDQVAYATTHNAMAARFDPYGYSIIISNQCSGVPTQLAEGIRALMLDIHWFQPEDAEAPDLYLCHSECPFGHQLLVDGLAEIDAYLDAHPAEVIAFIIETNAETSGREAQIRDAFAASGLLDHVHVQTPGAPWPTLGEMVTTDDRLVVLTDDSTPNAGCDADGDPCPWYHYLWSQLAFETHFTYSKPTDFSCADNRGAPGNDLFILNHFLTNNIGAPQFAQQVNHDPLLSSRARECWSFQGRIPNFVTVDFYEIGSVVRTANLLNFLWGQTGGAPPE